MLGICEATPIVDRGGKPLASGTDISTGSVNTVCLHQGRQLNGDYIIHQPHLCFVSGIFECRGFLR
jgi:hypothetical protein